MSGSVIEVTPPSARVLRCWGIAEAGTFTYLADGLMNRNWRLDVAGGRFFVKQFLDIDRRQIAFQHRVSAALAEAGLPVPAPIPAGDGRTLVTVNRKRFALYPWVDGRHRGGLELSYGECWELGRLLGRVHDGLAVVMPPVQQVLMVPTARPDDALALIDRLIDALPAERDDFDVCVERCLRERRVMLGELAHRRPPDVEALTVGYVHGDFHALNLLYGDGGEVAAVLDWDRLKVAPFGQEVVRAATLFFGFGDERGLDLDRVAAFVAGYRDRFGLGGGEIRSAVYRLWWERLCDFWILKWRYLKQDRSCDHLFAGAAALVRWWTENLEASIDAFAAAAVGSV